MNYDRVHSLFSKASEAIVTADGKIKKRLNSYETVVKQGDNEPFYIPEGAVNDNYGNLNYLTDQIRSRAINARISNLRYVMYGAFAVVVIVFSWSVYNFLLPSLSANNGEGQLNASPDDELAAQIHETQLERVANLIIIDDDWSDARISVFLKHWMPSSDEYREKYKATAWFQQFAFRLENKFNRAIYTGELFTENAANKRAPLYTLALAVGVADPEVNYAKRADENLNYSKLENEVTSELAEMEKSRIKDDGQDNSIVADEAVLAKLLKDTDGKPLLVAEPSTPNRPAGKEQKLQKPEAAVAAATSPSISEEDVSRILKKYSDAYAKGNMEELSSLFGVSDPVQGDRILEQLKSNYENVFINSQKRSVNFKGLNWRLDGNQATVDSDYSAHIELKNNKGVQTITASAKLGLVKQHDKLKIENFELLNRSVNVTTPELTIATADHTPKALPKAPTAAELQDIVTRLVSSYESGDLESFADLFAVNAKTNDRQNLDGIKRDYADLFNGSNDRQMFIQGMQWSFDENHAKGTGNLEAIVLSDTGNSVYSMGGKIQLVAQRIDGKVKITHMYHIERKK